jgi:hypothetical protein
MPLRRAGTRFFSPRERRATHSTVILRSRALARRLEGWPRVPVADPSRLAASRRAPQDDGNRLGCLLKKIFRIPYPRPQNLAYPARVLSDEGPLSRSDPLSGQSESWPDRGAPERLMAWWPVERWEALRLAMGARGLTMPREVGSPPASRVSHWASWRLPPLHPLAQVARGILQTSDASRRENAEVWLFEISMMNATTCPGRDAARSSCEALLRRTGTPGSFNRKQISFTASKPGPRLCSAPLRKGYALRCVRGTNRDGCAAATNVASTQHSTNI